MKIIGHRGASGHEPENTLRSIEAAIGLGADMVEIDVFAMPTGEAIVFHDELLDRVTNGYGVALEIDFGELRKLDAGKGEKIPTLQEVIECIDRRIPLIIEIKNAGAVALIAAIVKEYLQKGWRPGDFAVSSFNHHEIYAFKQLLPEVTSIALMYSIPLDYAAFCEPLQANVCAPAADMVTQEFVDDAHTRGLELQAWVWEPVTNERIRELRDMGVDGFYSDFPDETRTILA